MAADCQSEQQPPPSSTRQLPLTGLTVPSFSKRSLSQRLHPFVPMFWPLSCLLLLSPSTLWPSVSMPGLTQPGIFGLSELSSPPFPELQTPSEEDDSLIYTPRQHHPGTSTQWLSTTSTWFSGWACSKVLGRLLFPTCKFLPIFPTLPMAPPCSQFLKSETWVLTLFLPLFPALPHTHLMSMSSSTHSISYICLEILEFPFPAATY